MRQLVVPASVTANGATVLGLAVVGEPLWVVSFVAAPVAVWLGLVVVLAAASVFAEKRARRDAAYRTLKLITSLQVVQPANTGGPPTRVGGN
ncbi:hypothetical protein [Nocardia iowensis]|uniref:Uncharacterized protein n=1 Tax=Nocardia iowensis TaxID=204891 RepID=A0ABX8RQG3_NOCIO|nr:hypothetical protein [Nocardia iowensis]QXN91859.1 hypothetical protein KV110_01300 [Nocardia iowensis]